MVIRSATSLNGKSYSKKRLQKKQTIQIAATFQKAMKKEARG